MRQFPRAAIRARAVDNLATWALYKHSLADCGARLYQKRCETSRLCRGSRILRIIVVGAGIVGLSSAYWLARDGHRVTVVDRATSVGQGASFANGGQLSYSYVAPLAGPGVLRNLPRWLTNPNSPVKFRPVLDPGQLLWALSFVRACTDRRSRATSVRLLALAGHSRTALHDMIARESLAFAHRRNGKIVFYSTKSTFMGGVRQQALQAEIGSLQTVLTRDECLDIEPSLAAAACRIVGAVYTPSEEVGDCRLLCEELRRALSLPSYGVEFLLGAEVLGFSNAGRRVGGLSLADRRMEADLYVLCAGADSRRLAKTAGLHLPLYPVRGYSISMPIRDAASVPDKSVTDYENRIVYARVGGVLRAAGFADIEGAGAVLDAGRITTLAKAVGKLFPGSCVLDDLSPWVGARPATPTGVPIIGRSRRSNLLVNVGHGALGFTLGAGSGRMLADIVGDRHPGIDANDFAPP
jgi:D-amino-acid dehydrogenase